MTTRRKHRRVRSDWKGCHCPEGAKKVSTCKPGPDGTKLCRGRGWGCIGTGLTKKGKPSRRFVAAVCPGDGNGNGKKPKKSKKTKAAAA